MVRHRSSPCRASGIDTSRISAPRSLNASIAVMTAACTSGWQSSKCTSTGTPSLIPFTPRRSPRRTAGGRRVRQDGSRGSGPAIASSMIAASSAVSAIGPGMVERPALREHAVARHQPIGRLVPNQAAHVRRDADRPAGVAAKAGQPLARGHRCRRAAGGAAGNVAVLPGVVAATEERVVIGHAARPFVHDSPCRPAPRRPRAAALSPAHRNQARSPSGWWSRRWWRCLPCSTGPSG